MRYYILAATLLIFTLQSVSLQAKPNRKLASFTGSWIGEAYQYDVNETFKIALQCDGDTIKVQYSNLRCSGSWKLVKGKKRKLLLLEKIHYDPYDICTDNGLIKLVYAGENRWFIFYYHPNKDNLQAVGGIQRVRQQPMSRAKELKISSTHSCKASVDQC